MTVTTKLLKLPPHLTDVGVMKIMERHEAFRGTDSSVTPKMPGLRHLLEQPDLMTRDEFLEELNQIAPKIQVEGKLVRPLAIGADAAARIYQLRWRYENRIATSRSQRVPRYNTSTLWDQVRSGRILPLAPEEQAAVFGASFKRLNLFWLSDVLAIELGRWGESRRFKPAQEPKQPGRPKGAKTKNRQKARAAS